MKLRPVDAHSESYVGLDLLRGLAAAIVFIGHVRGSSFVEFGALPKDQQGILTAAFFAVTRIGHDAVLIFFVLSGFLVGGALIGAVRRGKFDLQQYAIARSARILVPLVPACILTGVLSYAFSREGTDIAALLASMVGLNDLLAPTPDNNVVLWSLTYEIWFYILAGVLTYMAARRCSIVTLFVALVCFAVFSKLETRYLLFWWMGTLVVYFLDAGYRKRLFFAGVLLAAVGTVSFELAVASKSFQSAQWMPTAVTECVLCAGICLMIPFLCTPAAERILNVVRSPAAYLASISYTLYLVHYPVNVVLDAYFPRASALTAASWGVLALRVAICLAVSLLFYYLFEYRTPVVRRFIRSRLHAKSRALQS